MRRAVILITLTLLLPAVAGVTVAQEGAFVAGSGGSDLPAEPGVSGSAESTALEAARLRTTAPGTVDEGAAEATIRKPEHTGRPIVVNPVGKNKPEATDEDEDAGRPQNVRRPDKAGKPASAGGPGGEGRPEYAGRPEGAGKPAGKGKPENEPGGRQRKVTLCHKSKVAITVGAPARDAHLRHGDDPGACE